MFTEIAGYHLGGAPTVEAFGREYYLRLGRAFLPKRWGGTQVLVACSTVWMQAVTCATLLGG